MQNGLQAIASAYGDYTKKSFEDTKSFVEKLSGVKSLDKAIEAQTDFAKSAYETFVAELQKIAGLYSDLAKQAFKPVERRRLEVHAGRPLIVTRFRKSKSPAVAAGLFSVATAIARLTSPRAASRSACRSAVNAVAIWLAGQQKKSGAARAGWQHAEVRRRRC